MNARMFANRNLIGSLLTSTVFGAAALLCAASSASAAPADKQDYIQTELPPGFQVVANDLEGPVFADPNGRTVYKWPIKHLRNGDAGEVENKPSCDSTVYRENAGLMSPYPPGLELPELDKRPSCTDMWPPVLAQANAKPVGKWTIVDRPDGRKQWAYDGFSLYTSVLDKQPGESLGGAATDATPESGATRFPVGPAPNVPSQFDVITTMRGRLVTLHEGWSVYAYERDGRDKSNCYGSCLEGWVPVLAGEYARPVGEWTTFERAPGVKQWAFRHVPVYRFLGDAKIHSQDGSDMPGWRNVYMQTTPLPPAGFVMKDTIVGEALGAPNGSTVYKYICTDDALDQLACDHPDAPQVYRLAICGGFDAERCQKVFPYVVAPAGAKNSGQLWTAMDIDPKTGKKAAANQPGALHVWAYRGRPVYTFAGEKHYGDRKPSDILANDWGEFNAQRNGFRALVYRDVYSQRDE